MAKGTVTVTVQMELSQAILLVLASGEWVSMHALRAGVGKIVDMREHESALLDTVNAMEREKVIETKGRYVGGFAVRLARKGGV